jgi:hypothetical protein
MTTETTDTEVERRTDGERSTEPTAGDDALTCAHCGQSFERERPLALHRGLRHGDALSEGERTAFEDARASEERELRRFRLKALIALVVLYFGLLMAYAAFS